MGQLGLVNKYSHIGVQAMAGTDRNLIFDTATPTKEEAIVPQIAKNYLPHLDNKGDLIIKYDNGETQNLSLEMLLNNPDNLKGIPKVAQDYVLKIQDSLFKDGQMIEPTREMFKKGFAGDKAFRDFLEIYFELNPEIGLTGHTGKGGVELHYSFSDWFKKIYEGTKILGTGTKKSKPERGAWSRPKHYADIDQFVTNEVSPSLDTDAFPITTDPIAIKELNQGKTIKQDEIKKQPIQEDKKKINPKQSGSSFLKHQNKGISSEASDAIKQVEEQAMLQGDNAQVMQAGLAGDNKFINQIMKDEGKPFLEATKVFKDEKNFSIGYGRNNANVKKGDKITLEKAQENLAEDVKIRLEEIQDLIPNFRNLSDQLQLALFSEYYRGSVRQSPDTVKLINAGKFSEAAAEFLDNDEYRNAVERGRRGIRKRMKRVFDLLQREGTQESPAV